MRSHSFTPGAGLRQSWISGKPSDRLASAKVRVYCLPGTRGGLQPSIRGRLTTQSSRTCFASRLISDVRHCKGHVSPSVVLPACGAPSSLGACAGFVISSVTLRLHASRLRAAIDAQLHSAILGAGVYHSWFSGQLPDGLASARVHVYRLLGSGVGLQPSIRGHLTIRSSRARIVMACI